MENGFPGYRSRRQMLVRAHTAKALYALRILGAPLMAHYPNSDPDFDCRDI